MRFSFETLGNATLAFREDDRPVVATDPCLMGTCYFGSWGLDRPLTEDELALVHPASICGFRMDIRTTSTSRR